MTSDVDEQLIMNEVKKKDYQDMLIFMFQNSKSEQIKTIIHNIIEYLKNPRNYIKDVKEKLKDMLDKYNAKPKGSKRQKNELAKILDSKANYFIDISGLLKDKAAGTRSLREQSSSQHSCRQAEEEKPVTTLFSTA